MLVIQVIKEDSYRGSSMGIHGYKPSHLTCVVNQLKVKLQLRSLISE